MTMVVAGYLLAKVAVAFGDVPDAFAVLPAGKTLGSWVLSYLQLSLSLALLWVLLVSTARFYSRYLPIHLEVRSLDSRTSTLHAAFRNAWRVKDQECFEQYLEGAGRKERPVCFSQPRLTDCGT